MSKISVVAAAALFGGFAGYAAAQSNSDLPDIGSPAGTIANLDDEYQIGRMAIREFREQNEIVEDPEVSDYIQTLGLRLSSQAPDSNRGFPLFRAARRRHQRRRPPGCLHRRQLRHDPGLRQ